MKVLRFRDSRLEQLRAITSGMRAMSGIRREDVSSRRMSLDTALIWFVLEGFVRREHLVEGRYRLADIHGSGSVVCPAMEPDEQEILCAEPESRLLGVSYPSLMLMANNGTQVVTTIIRELSLHQDSLRRRLRLQSTKRGASRLVVALREIAREIGSPCSHGHSGWTDIKRLTHQDLADLTNNTRPHLSCLLKQLVEESSVDRQKGRVLCVSPAVQVRSIREAGA